jgi:hypothetical protein
MYKWYTHCNRFGFDMPKQEAEETDTKSNVKKFEGFIEPISNPRHRPNDH